MAMLQGRQEHVSVLRDTSLHVKLARCMGEIDLQVPRDELLGISLANLEIIILSTFVLWRLFEFSSNKIMIAGVILGETCHLSNTSWLHNIYFPDDSRPKVPETLAAFGFLLYWFLKGVTMDAGTGLKMGKKASVIGFTTMFVPLVCGNIMFRLRKRRGNITLLTTEYRLLMFLQSISAFTSIDTLLRDLKIKHSEFGRIALPGSMEFGWLSLQRF